MNNDILVNVTEQLPLDEELYDLAEFFKVFADSTRIKILHALSISELCVYDLATLLNVSQSAVSHQLRTLKQMRLVKFRRDGKVIYYSLADSHIELILKQGFEHINE
ncbi:MAG: helix-turn-helix transcriptional regulator [Lachnospiraceae bacterium]|nr:helix-turn-helix transcriptional regulator [Lachnospiraceae bacterium]